MVLIQAAPPRLRQRRPSAVPHQALEAVAVPVRDLDLGVDRPAAFVAERVQGVDGQVVEVAVAVQPAQATATDLLLDRGDVRGVQLEGRMELAGRGLAFGVIRTRISPGFETAW